MSENNLPPFYVGQRVVAIENWEDLKIGDIHTILEVKKSCCGWDVWLGHKEIDDTPSLWRQQCGICGEWELKNNNKVYYNSKRISPVHENFQSISLEKVLEEETKLISVN